MNSQPSLTRRGFLSSKRPLNPICKTMVCETGLRIVRSGGICTRCKINGVPMYCTLGRPEGSELPTVPDAGAKALEAAREDLRINGPAVLCSFDKKKGNDCDNRDHP